MKRSAYIMRGIGAAAIAAVLGAGALIAPAANAADDRDIVVKTSRVTLGNGEVIQGSGTVPAAITAPSTGVQKVLRANSFIFQYQILMLGDPTDYWVVSYVDPTKRASCFIWKGNPLDDGTKRIETDSPFVCDVIDARAQVVFTVSLNSDSEVSGSIDLQGPLSATGVIWATVHPYRTFTYGDFSGRNEFSAVRRVGDKRGEDAPITADLTSIIRIVDDGRVTPYWVAASASNERGSWFHWHTTSCRFYLGGTSGEALDRGPVVSGSPYECAIKDRTKWDERINLIVDFTVTKKEQQASEAVAAPSHVLRIENEMSVSHLQMLAPEIRSVSGDWTCTSGDEVVAEGRWNAPVGDPGERVPATLSGPSDEIPAGAACSAQADDLDSFAADPALDWKTDGTEVVVGASEDANLITVTTGLTRGAAVDEPVIDDGPAGGGPVDEG